VTLTVKFAGLLLPLLLLMLLESGCTYALWTNGNLVDYKEPAPNPDLHLFESKQGTDYLVVYKEYSERTDSFHGRAYWLNKNQTRVERQKAPVFAGRKQTRKLTAVPVFYSMPQEEFTKGIYAVCDTNQQSFALFSGNRQVGSYDFPVYEDKLGNVEKVALTPLAVTADVSVAGAIVAVIVAYGWCEGDYTFPVGR
jgi:hypothetical protein